MTQKTLKDFIDATVQKMNMPQQPLQTPADAPATAADEIMYHNMKTHFNSHLWTKEVIDKLNKK